MPDLTKTKGIPYKWMALAAVSIGTFMTLLDSTMVNIALPTITRVLNSDIVTVQWVVTTYLLVVTSSLLVFGRLGDLYGRKKVFVIGFALFTIASGFCGLAQDMGQLIAFRALQGLGGGMMMAIGPALGAGSFPPSERGMALGVSMMVVAAGAMMGPTLGGYIIDAFDWRTAFFLRVPVGVIGTVWATSVLRKEASSSADRRFDLPGAITLSLTLFSLLLAVGQGQSLGWISLPIQAFFAFSVICAVAFVLIERKMPMPLVQLSLFRNRVFVGANVSSILSSASMSVNMLLIPFYLQRALSFSASQVGLMLIPGPLIMASFSPFSGWLSDRIGTRYLCFAGLILQSLGLLLCATLGEQASYGEVVVRLAIISLGAALFISPNSSTIMSSVAPNLLGFTASTMATARNLGMVLGTALAASLFAGRVDYHTARLALASVEGEALSRSSMVFAFKDTAIVGAAICSLGLLASFLRKQQMEYLVEEARPQPVSSPLVGED